MTSTAIPASTTLLAQLADPAARAVLLAAAAGLGLAAFRVRTTSTRLFTWTAVLYAALAMPFLGWMLPPLPILPRRHMSVRASLALTLSILAFFVPFVGQAAALVLVLPLALGAQGAIRRSSGRVRGMGRAVAAIILALINIIGFTVLLDLLFTGKIKLL